MIQTGKQPISVATLCAILSISLVVNLPGLAVTPMLGTLSTVFPAAGQLEKQLLTVLPNLLIIPFVLLSGKLSLTRHKRAIVILGLVIFTGCAVGYLFARTMGMLIVYSCLLGCGAGLLIPFSTGLIADAFEGKYRMREMGVQSGISNSALVAATFAVGWLSHSGWHLPFVVYLVAIIPLLLTPRLKGIDNPSPAAPAAFKPTAPAATGERVVDGFYPGRIVSLVALYGFITVATISITYYCPFLIEKKDWSSSLTGTVTALFFLFMLIPGFTLPWFVKIMKGWTFVVCGAVMTLGMALFAFVPLEWCMCVGAALAGLGYGICQPLIYDKASRAVVNTRKATMSLAKVLSADYVAVVLTPFIIDGLRSLFHGQGHPTFAFTACFVMLVAYTAFAFWKRHTFAFAVSPSYY